MDNITTFRIELEVAAQKVIHQFMMGNEQIEKQLSKSIQSAINSFDFEKEVSGIVHKQLRQAINNSFAYGELQKLVEERTNAIFERLIEAEFSKYQDLGK